MGFTETDISPKVWVLLHQILEQNSEFYRRSETHKDFTLIYNAFDGISLMEDSSSKLLAIRLEDDKYFSALVPKKLHTKMFMSHTGIFQPFHDSIAIKRQAGHLGS